MKPELCGNPECKRNLVLVDPIWELKDVKERFCSRLCRYLSTGEIGQTPIVRKKIIQPGPACFIVNKAYNPSARKRLI